MFIQKKSNWCSLFDKRDSEYIKPPRTNIKPYILARTEAVADYIIETRCTAREAGEKFGISKSLVWFDMRDVLPRINMSKREKVKEIFTYNSIHRGSRHSIKVKSIDYNGNEIEYESINEASRAVGTTVSCIRDVLDKPTRSCYGYAWKKVKE